MKIEKNLGTADKVVRLLFSAVVIILVLFQVIGGPVAVGLLVLSAILLVTVFFSFCPIYRLIGLSSRKGRSS